MRVLHFRLLEIFNIQQQYLHSAILVFLLLIVYRLTNKLNARPSSEPLRSPRVKYSLPWIGSAIELAKDQDAFFRRASSQLGPVFRVKTLGREMTYVTSPDLISAIHRDVKAFNFTPIKLEAMHRIFGVSHATTYSPSMTDGYLALHHRALNPANIENLLQRYTEFASEQVVKALYDFDGTTTDLALFIVPPAYYAATYTVFGRTFCAEKFYNPFKLFDNSFPLLLAGIPKFMIPGPYRALEQVNKMFEQYLGVPHEDGSELVYQLENAATDAGWPTSDFAKLLTMELWALLTNAMFVPFWVIALSLQDPENFAALVKEVDGARLDWKARHSDQLPDVSQHQWLLDASLPLLTSAIREALRLSTSVLSIRRVNHPLEFAGYTFKAGEEIICVTRAVHMDYEIHPNPYLFHPQRYMSAPNDFTKNGKAVPNHSMPFGGGISMCEGRHFAMAELRIYLALILSHVTLEIDQTSASRPKYLLTRIGGLMPPVGDLKVKIRRRNLIH